MSAAYICSHCQLPVGRFGEQREVEGTVHHFCCYGCCLAYQVLHRAREEPEADAHPIRLGVGGFLAMNIMLFSLLLYAGAFAGPDAWLAGVVPWLLWALTTPLLLLLGGPFFGGAWRAARMGRMTADTLVSLGAMAAYGYSAWQVVEGGGQVYFDTATMVLLLFTLGRYLEAQGRVRAVRSLAPMLAAERAEVRVVQAGTEVIRSVDQVLPGELVRVRPGERIAVDGRVVEGRSECDESILTGQPEPRFKAPGDSVHAGSLNGRGQLLVCAESTGDATRWVRISRMVREALAEKSLVGEAVDRVAAWFIPWVLLLAVATVWYWANRGGLDQGLLTGLAVLVVACPCSLGLAAPLAMVLGIGRAAQRGILVRGGGVLEKLARLKGIAFDKTGTLTQGRFQLVSLAAEGAPEPEVLRRAAGLASGSDHPIARAVAELGRRSGLDITVAAEIQDRPGAGLTGRTDGEDCALGSAAFMADLGWPVPVALAPSQGEGTQIYVGWAERVRGRLSLADSPRSEAGPVIAALHVRGLRTLMLSGDGEAAVARLATGLGIPTWRAGLAPEAKVAILREWGARRGRIAMVGDGLNDGPVLAAASVGIAVGGASDLAKESADVILPEGGLALLPWLLQLSDQVRRSVRANLVWALGYNFLALSLAAGGLLQPVFAAALMAGSSLVVVTRTLNAARGAHDPVQGEPGSAAPAVAPQPWGPAV
jgi:P-type Cu2+ transporter